MVRITIEILFLDFSNTKLKRILNSELADTLGNLLSRCCGKTVNQNQVFPNLIREDFDLYCRGLGGELIEALDRLPGKPSSESEGKYPITREVPNWDSEFSGEIAEHYSELNFYKGIAAVVSCLHEGNKYFESSKPWELRKSPEKRNQLDSVLHLTMETLRMAGIALLPIVPRIASSLLDKISIPQSERNWSMISPSWHREKTEALQLNEDKIILYQRITS